MVACVRSACDAEDMTSAAPPPATALTSDLLLKHWLGHRRLTCRTIVAFPEPALFEHHACYQR